MTTTTELVAARATDLGRIRHMLEEQRLRRFDVVASATALGAWNGKLTVATGEVQMDADGVTPIAGIYDVGDVFNEGLADRFSLPRAHMRRWCTERTDIWDGVVNMTLHGGERAEGAPYPADDRKHFVRLLKGDGDEYGFARALMSGKYAPIETLDALIAVLRGAAEAGIEVKPDVCDLTERRCLINLIAPGITGQAPHLLNGYESPFEGKDARIRAGDAGNPEWVSQTRGWSLPKALAAAEREGKGIVPNILKAGLRFSNSEVGQGKRTLVPFMLAEVCGNRLVLDLEADSKVHLGSEQAEGVVEWSQETVDAELVLIQSQTVDVVKRFLSPEFFAEQVERVESMAGAPISDPEKTVKDIAAKVGFTKAEADAVFDLFTLQPRAQRTAGGLANAITAHAQTVASGDRAAEMERKAIKAMELAAA